MSTNATVIENLQISERPWTELLHEWVTTVDHKRLGILYILYALSYLAIAGIEALIIRVQLMHAHNNFVSPQVFNRMFTMHGTTMIFFVVMPVLFGFANYFRQSQQHHRPIVTAPSNRRIREHDVRRQGPGEQTVALCELLTRIANRGDGGTCLRIHQQQTAAE